MTEITRAPDPIKPLRGRGIDYWAADSSKWVNVPQAPLWQVVALSLGIEPVSLNMARREFCPPVFRDRFDVAWGNRGHGLPEFEHGGSPVGLRAFGDWALALPQPLELPVWFPRTRVDGQAPTAAKESPVVRQSRRAARLAELGARMEESGGGWKVSGKRGAMMSLVREEASAGRPMADRKNVREDLIAASLANRGS